MKSLFILTVGLLAVVPTRGAVIYFDDFSGSGSVALNGSAPDIRPGSETWIAGTGSLDWNQDGSITGGVSNNSNAFLPFSPTAGNIYTLSIDVDPTTPANSSNWFAVGFSNTAGVDSGIYSGVGLTDWMLARVDRSGDDAIETFLGPNTASSGSYSSGAGFVNLKVVLNTTGVDWTAEWFFNDVSIRGPETFATTPTINYVAFGKIFDAAGAVDNFTLSDVAIPEPATSALLGGIMVGGFAFLAHRRKRLAAPAA